MIKFRPIVNFFNCLLIISALFFCNCNGNKTQNNTSANTFGPKVISTKGYVVPSDSMSQPTVIIIDESKLTKIPAGKPKIVITNTNIHPVGTPKIILAGVPKIITPGKDTFGLPKIIPAIDSPFVAGIPETVIVKDAAVKDQNPQGFSSFGKLQGLKHGNVNCLLEDKNGNIWFGTNGGGISKYDGNTFTHYTEKEGLANNAIWSMLEDRNGSIWIGTSEGGVSKFDGKFFTNFTEKEGLSSNVVFSILEDKTGNIWFGTNGGGASKYDGKKFTYFTDKEGLADNSVLSMLQDKAGNIWFGTAGGVSKYDGKTFMNFTDKEGLSNNEVFSILEDKVGNIWFGTYSGGVSKFDGKFFTNFTENEGLSNNEVLAILEDKNGNIWFGTNGGGISKYNGKSFTHYTEKEGLTNNIVRGILEDKSGNLWFGTHGGGVSKYDGKIFSHFTEKEGLSNNVIFSILQDKSENLWLCSFGGGISKYDGKFFTQFSVNEGLPNDVVWSSLQDKLGNLWFGTSGGVSKYDGKTFTHFTEKDGLASNDVRSICEDKFGNLWFGTSRGGVSKYNGNRIDAIERGDKITSKDLQELKNKDGKFVKSFTNFSVKEGLPIEDVRSVLEDKFGNIWFGTYGGGVSMYDGKTFTHFTKKEGLNNNIVMSLLEDKSGNLWFGTYGGGLTMYDRKSFTHFTEKEGLSNNVVMSMLEDKLGNLWFGTRFGLSKLSKKKLIEFENKAKTNSVKEADVFFKNFTYEDGFLGIGCFNNSICESKDGTIWIGTNDRLTAYHPDGESEDTLAPNIQLTGLELYNENISWVNFENRKDSTITLGNGVKVSNFKFDGVTKWQTLPINLSLNYNNNYLTFNFIGITQKQPKKVKYQYKLEGIDENWSAITNRTSAPYGNLPHGTYTFKVKAMSSGGYWSNEISYVFTIRPPFWKTWWFRTLAFFAIVSGIYFFIRSRERELNERQKELEHKIDIATEDIKQQKHIIEEHQKGTIDSINYAKRIQFALLANDNLLKENLNENFVLFNPKDIISGDFYWATKHNDKFYLAVCDSTGHGVPGAFMSLLNMGFLSEAIKEKNISKPNEILNYVRTRLIDCIGNEGQQDGMDAILVCFEENNSTITYAAANNSPVLVRNNQVMILPKDKMPVGKGEFTNSFSLQTVEVLKNDFLYLYTDGYADQFGGPKGKKFKYKPLNELLLSISNMATNQQSTILSQTIDNWKGDLEQVDDICIVGIKI